MRVASAAIVLHEEKILLVRYKDKNGGSFLVGPGGGIQGDESLFDAVKREVFEETRLLVRPDKMLFIEDLLTVNYRMLKIWFLCEFVSGEIAKSKEAHDEGIIEVAWFGKTQLCNEIVYPSAVLDCDWKDFYKAGWETKYFVPKKVDF